MCSAIKMVESDKSGGSGGEASSVKHGTILALLYFLEFTTEDASKICLRESNGIESENILSSTNYTTSSESVCDILPSCFAWRQYQWRRTSEEPAMPVVQAVH